MGISAMERNHTVSGSFWQEIDALAPLSGSHGSRDSWRNTLVCDGLVSCPERAFSRIFGSIIIIIRAVALDRAALGKSYS